MSLPGFFYCTVGVCWGKRQKHWTPDTGALHIPKPSKFESFQKALKGRSWEGSAPLFCNPFIRLGEWSGRVPSQDRSALTVKGRDMPVAAVAVAVAAASGALRE